MKIVYGVSKLKNNESDIAKKRIGKSKLNSKKKTFDLIQKKSAKEERGTKDKVL